MSSYQRSSLCYSTDYNISYIFNIALLNAQWHIIIIKAITGIHRRTGQGGREGSCPPWIWETSKILADGMGNSGIQGTEFF